MGCDHRGVCAEQDLTTSRLSASRPQVTSLVNAALAYGCATAETWRSGSSGEMLGSRGRGRQLETEGLMNATEGAGASSACSFCGDGAAQVNHLISGPGVWICDRCVRASYEIIQSLEPTKTSGASAGDLAPTIGADAAVPMDDPVMATVAQVQQAALQGHREQPLPPSTNCGLRSGTVARCTASWSRTTWPICRTTRPRSCSGTSVRWRLLPRSTRRTKMLPRWLRYAHRCTSTPLARCISSAARKTLAGSSRLPGKPDRRCPRTGMGALCAPRSTRSAPR